MTDLRPTRICGREVVRFRDEWSIIDRWWTNEPDRREYLEVELADGGVVEVVRRPGGAWDLVPWRSCDKCRRSTWNESEFGQVCGMTQPDGSACDGKFVEARFSRR